MDWTAAELSELLAVDRALIDEAIKAGAWEHKRGKFDSKVGIRGFVAWLVARGSTVERSLKKIQEELAVARLEKTQEEKKRLVLDREEREARKTVAHEKFSENQLSEMTGLDRRTVKKRLEDEEHEIAGHARLYTLRTAIRALTARREMSGSGMSLERARIEESQSKTRLNQIQIETLEKSRIPVESVIKAGQCVFGEVVAAIERSPLPEVEKLSVRAEIKSQLEALQCTE